MVIRKQDNSNSPSEAGLAQLPADLSTENTRHPPEGWCARCMVHKLMGSIISYINLGSNLQRAEGATLCCFSFIDPGCTGILGRILRC